MRRFFLLGFIITTGCFNAYCQEAPASNGNKVTSAYFPITFSVGTQVPVQNEIRISYNFRKLRRSYFSMFLQAGYPSYMDEAIDYIFDEEDPANTYLKKHLEGRFSAGCGTYWNSSHWRLGLLFQYTSYAIRNRTAREMVENLIPENGEEIVTAMNNFSMRFPMFGDFYNNYLLTSKIWFYQLGIQGGYQFKLYKDSRFGCRIEIGAITVFSNSLEITSNQSNIASDFVISAITEPLNEEIQEGMQWTIIPTVSLSMAYNF